MRQFAISDIHGCNITFKALLDQIGLTTADELFLLGDYIDRGPDSKGVLDTILQMQKDGYQLHCLMGNHDEAIVSARHDHAFFEKWLAGWGGEETLASFKVKHCEGIASEYWSFLQGLRHFVETDGYILVHAGLDFRMHDPLIFTSEMLYIRDWYNDIHYGWLGDRCIVHGHTPVTLAQAEALLAGLDNHQVIGIDTGCFAGTRLPGSGYLTAFDMTNRQLFFQKNLDDVSAYWAGR